MELGASLLFMTESGYAGVWVHCRVFLERRRRMRSVGATRVSVVVGVGVRWLGWVEWIFFLSVINQGCTLPDLSRARAKSFRTPRC